jgi:leucyl aminopeptidase
MFTGPTGLTLQDGSPLDREVATALWKSLVETGATGAAGETRTVPAPDNAGAREVLAVGLGHPGAGADEVRDAAGVASRVLRARPDTGAGGITVLSLLGVLSPAAAVEGHALGAYRYSGLRTSPPRTGTIARLGIVVRDRDDGRREDDTAAFIHACTVVEAVAVARDLVNAPANRLYPESYADLLTDLAGRSGVTVEVLDDDDLRDLGYGGILGVAAGSVHPPRLVRLRYRPEPSVGAAVTPHVALVGKGVTFDSGGVSLKKASGMDTMISDMAGSAAVAAAVIAASELELPVAVTATVPLAENMPDAASMRPGDVLRHYGGTTTEVLNTDAEGRLILADAIARAVEDGPDLLVEVSTLTGAQVSSFGDRVTAVMGTPSLRDRVTRLAAEVGEEAWPAPLPAETAREIRSDVADLRNTGRGRGAGMAAAGHYLAAFVPEPLPWVHLDVAGPAFNTGAPHGEVPRRATGCPVRTLVALLEDLSR